ncbi:hypothetical protein DU99_02435 [Sinorhizobium meliloti]|nr:hypothetical protein DU99_02435 [Sinorhizobium meliloti]
MLAAGHVAAADADREFACCRVARADADGLLIAGLILSADGERPVAIGLCIRTDCNGIRRAARVRFVGHRIRVVDYQRFRTRTHAHGDRLGAPGLGLLGLSPSEGIISTDCDCPNIGRVCRLPDGNRSV